jgi:hypothetical protein
MKGENIVGVCIEKYQMVKFVIAFGHVLRMNDACPDARVVSRGPRYLLPGWAA